MPTPNPALAHTFESHTYAFDAAQGALDLHYHYPEQGLTFHERIIMPPADAPLSPAREAAAHRAAQLVFLLAGVSYAKAFMPETIRCTAFAVPPTLANFLSSVYQNGLAECAFRNQVDSRGRLRWETTSETAPQPFPPLETSVSLPNDGSHPYALVPLGGGKDSFVTWDCLSRAGVPKRGFILAAADAPLPTPLARTVAALGESTIVIARRKLCPTLAHLNRQGLVFNGHVPITAIVSAIATLVAVTHGHSHVVFSNEHSASEATRTTDDGASVNHQYSKSFAFERAFADIVKQNVTPSVHVFSLLRPWTEVAIARRFASLTHWHPVFCSCNATFRHIAETRASTWCGTCPKCHFVFLALAPFLRPEALATLFGHDLLADDTQRAGFLALLDLANDKPFECVGTAQESRLIVWHLAHHPLWREHSVVRMLTHKLGDPPADAQERWDTLFTPRGDHGIDKDFTGLRLL